MGKFNLQILLIVSSLCFVVNDAIQVFENIQNDTTTLASLAVSPLPTSSIATATAINELSSSNTSESMSVVQIVQVEKRTKENASIAQNVVEGTTSASDVHNLKTSKSDKSKKYVCLIFSILV